MRNKNNTLVALLSSLLSLGGCAADVIDDEAAEPEGAEAARGAPALPTVEGGLLFAGEPPGSALWSMAPGSTGYDTGIAVATDGSGNSYVTGYFAAQIDLGCGAMVATGAYDMFLAKLNSAGACVWSRRAGGSANAAGMAVKVAPNGTVVVVGSFDGTITLGGSLLTSAGGYDGFLATYTAGGTAQLGRRYGGTSDEYLYGLAVNAGRIVLAGAFYGTVDFSGTGTAELVSKGDADLFVAAFNSAGDYQWAKGYGSTGWDATNAVAIDANDVVYVGGLYEGAMEFGGTALANGGSWDGFLAALTGATGATQFVRSIGGPGYDSVAAVALDSTGAPVIAGVFSAAVNAGGANLVGVGSTSTFLARYSNANVHLWSRAIDAANGYVMAMTLAIDSFNDIVVGGQFAGTADFGATSTTGADMWVAKYLVSTGDAAWARRFGLTGTAATSAVAVGSGDTVVATGYFDGTIDLAASPTTTIGMWDVAVVSLAP